MNEPIYSREGEDLTPRDITDLSLEEQVQFIAQWFRLLHEDPQNETPYASDKDSEHNYEYIWGGPYDAREEIQSYFDTFASEEAIEAAVAEVEKRGIIEWAPTSAHPDHADNQSDPDDPAYPTLPTFEEIRERLASGVSPHFGNTYEMQLRDLVREAIVEWREEWQKAVEPGIGHNHPPGPIEEAAALQINLPAEVEAVEGELSKSEPDLQEVVSAAGKLKAALDWLGAKADKAVDSFAVSFGSTLGTASANAIVQTVKYGTWFAALYGVFNALLKWLDVVTLPF